METHEKIYAVLLEMKEDFGAMKTDIKAVKEMVILTNGKVQKHDLLLENWKGKIAVLVVAAGFIGNIVINWIKTKLNI